MNLILFLILFNYIKPIILPLTAQKTIDDLNETKSSDIFHNLKCKDKKCSLVKNKCKIKKTKCKFSIKYVEGSSINGIYINELIRFNYNDIPFEFPIGCTINETNSFKNQLPDGVLGIKYSKKSFISNLYKLKIIKYNLFKI